MISLKDDEKVISCNKWQFLRLEELLEEYRGGVWGKETRAGIGFPVLRSTNMRGGILNFSEVAWCDVSQEQAKIAQLKLGDIIVTKSSGSPHLVGLPALFEENSDGKTYLFSNFTLRLRPNLHKVVPKFLFYYLSGEKAASDRKGMAQDTTGLRNLKVKEYLSQSIPIPPLDEQRRIVARLEAILDQIRTARTALERIPPLLKTFRQAVLAAAFRGELTERSTAARSEPGYEPASVLLERIRAERRRRWEESLRAKGKDPDKAVYVEPSAPDTSTLPELPEGWVWTTLQMIADVRSGVTKGRDLSKFKTIEVPYLRVANVQAGYLDLSEVKQITIKASELEGYKLQVNDVLYTEGGDRDKLGRGTVWKGQVDPCIHQNHIFCARLYVPDLIPEWVSMTGQLEYARSYVNSVASQSVNLASINSTNLKAMPIPLPPVQEQTRIVEKIQQLSQEVERGAGAFSIVSHRLDTLEQATLAKAFQGEL